MTNTLPQLSPPNHESGIPDTPAARMFPNPHMKSVEGDVDLNPALEQPYIASINAEAKALKEGADPNSLPLYSTTLSARTEALGRITDPLTGLLNREGVNEWFERTKPEKFAIFFADGDEFGKINKMYGHHIGDEVIRFIGENVTQKLRTGTKPMTPEQEEVQKKRAHPQDKDIVGFIDSNDSPDAGVGRVGGDEFVFVVDMTNVPEGEEETVMNTVSERVNQSNDYTASNGATIRVRISAAGMLGRASDGRNIDSYKDELDKQLQPEKQGRKMAKILIEEVWNDPDLQTMLEKSRS